MTWLIFVVGAALCWGMYGPMLHIGQTALGSPMRALLWVGVAYFLIAILIPGGVLVFGNEKGQFTREGNMGALAAGALGALGAVCITYALRTGGTPIFVMPLVFCGAPIVNVIFTMILHPPKVAPNPMLYVGFALAATGAFLVLRFKPA